MFKKLVLRDLEALESTKMKIRHNISKEDRLCLQKLASDDSLTIKPADKGGGLVILDTEVYRQEVERQLNDATFYRRVEQDPTPTVQRQVKLVLSEGLALDFISKELFEFIYIEFPRVPVFYILPKIQKPGFPHRGHPIVALQKSLLENISKYVDSLLQPFVFQVESYVRNTSDFITKIENIEVPENALLVSFDVTSLYTNIRVEDARKVVRFYLEKESYEGPPVQYVLQLMDLLLEKNYFKHKND